MTAGPIFIDWTGRSGLEELGSGVLDERRKIAYRPVSDQEFLCERESRNCVMPIATQDVVWVEEPKIGFWEATFLPAIAAGLKVTVGHITNYRPTTIQFPEVKPELPLHYRGVHRLNRDEQGRVKCVACMLCATACPADCIAIEAEAAPPEWPDRDKFPRSFVLDELRCIYCGMCEEACPVDAIELTHIYDMTGHSREEMLFDREKLLSVYDETKDNPRDPVRTKRGRLGPASEFAGLPAVAPATSVPDQERAAHSETAGVIRGVVKQD